jgi:amino acid adenylation domain-containing protein
MALEYVGDPMRFSGARRLRREVAGDEDGTVAARVAAVARALPEAPAVVAGERRLAYGELLAEADFLAADLTRRGVGPNVAVGVCIERSPALIIATLAVMRAGGAFIPLDPDWPDARVAQTLSDAKALLVLATAANAGRLGAAGCEIVAVDGARQAPASIDFALARTPSEDDLAYIIYTSGSTGEPKGVEITQRNLANLVDWHIEAFEVTAADRASCLAGLAFDACVWEIWPHLAAGACVFLVEEQARASRELLREWLIEHGITIAFLPTPLAEPLIASAWPGSSRLRLLLTGGDRLQARPLADLPFEVVNNYGPTECTVVATSGAVEPDGSASAPPPIGWPIRNTRIYILDEAGAPCAPGKVGEIYIGGDSVGRGYRGRADLTAERFIAHPEGGPGARLYRTGDLGAWLPDGQVAFHGRADDQLKIRGHRVEPAEIALALNRHPRIAQSAVIGRSSGAQTTLVAYLVAADEGELALCDLREFLAGMLPHFMIPSIFVRIPALPLTANGKLDRAALPPPSPANTLRDTPYRAPSNPVEQRLAQLVAEFLGVEDMGIDDNFFYLGGHSLLGTQLVLRTRDIFGVELALRDFFEAPTIAGLAQRIERLVVEKVARMSEDEARAHFAH